MGDVVPLKIGDQVNENSIYFLFAVAKVNFCVILTSTLNFLSQVPADGILISGQSLAIDESSMTGESKIVGNLIFNSAILFPSSHSHTCCMSTFLFTG